MSERTNRWAYNIAVSIGCTVAVGLLLLIVGWMFFSVVFTQPRIWP